MNRTAVCQLSARFVSGPLAAWGGAISYLKRPGEWVWGQGRGTHPGWHQVQMGLRPLSLVGVKERILLWRLKTQIGGLIVLFAGSVASDSEYRWEAGESSPSPSAYHLRGMVPNIPAPLCDRPVKQGLVFPLYRQGSWGTERLRDLSMVTQLVKCRSKMGSCQITEQIELKDSLCSSASEDKRWKSISLRPSGVQALSQPQSLVVLLRDIRRRGDFSSGLDLHFNVLQDPLIYHC